MDEKTPIKIAEKADAIIYKPPTTGFVSFLPSSWAPYAQLMRLDRPAGFYAFYFPYLVGIAYAASTSSEVLPPLTLTKHAGLFFVWCIILRGASCTWNDNIDQDFDREVARCRNRPIARGAVSTTQGHIFTIVQLFAGAALLQQFPDVCSTDAIFIAVLFFIYPFGKRFTNYPQLILGFPFAAAIFMACHALGADPVSQRMLSPTVYFCLGNVLWTMIYDTIYAHQDIKDDIKAGVKSMAVRFKDTTKPMTSVLAVVQIILLAVAGQMLELGLVYFLITCAGTTLCLVSMIYLVDLSVPESCAWWFKADFWLVGGTMFFGLLGEYAQRLL